jgi:hypothetical protein
MASGARSLAAQLLSVGASPNLLNDITVFMPCLPILEGSSSYN